MTTRMVFPAPRALLLAFGALALAVPALSLVATAGAAPGARAARAVVISDKAHLHLVTASGSELQEAGNMTGTIPGTVKGRFNIGPKIKIAFTLYPRTGGSIRVRGVAQPLSAGLHSKFSGSITVTGGAGRYAHAHGKGHLSGVMNRQTWKVSADVSGKLYY
jgi:hypothetical protein